jgi:hypothetical protein
MIQAMSELRKKRLAATYEVQVKIGGEWRVANATEDREEAILEAVALTGAHHGLAPVRVLGELNDVLTNSVRASVVWSHKPPPQLPPADAFELKREKRVNARKGLLGERPALFGLGGALLLGLLALAVYVGTHINMANVRY